MYIFRFPNLGIQHVTKKRVADVLYNRMVDNDNEDRRMMSKDGKTAEDISHPRMLLTFSGVVAYTCVVKDLNLLNVSLFMH